MKSMEILLGNILSRLERIEHDLYGSPEYRHVREYHGNAKVVFPNDLGFTPNRIVYQIDNVKHIGTIENGIISGDYIKSGKIGSRQDGELQGEIVFEKKLDRDSKIVFEKNHTGVKNDIQQIKDAAKIIVGMND